MGKEVAKIEKGSKQPELQEIIDKLEKYRQQLFDNPKISSTKFANMQTTIHWAKQIVRDCYGAEREKNAIAWIK
jgi:hypothetical protein